MIILLEKIVGRPRQLLREHHAFRAGRRRATPRSIADALLALGKISPEKAKTIKEAMARTCEADQAGNKAACEQALEEVERTISP